jgi:HK97 family phage prohead protease
MELRNFQLTDFEYRAEEGKAQHASGYAAVFNSDSHDLGGFVEVIEPGAFTRSLTAASAGSLNIFALWAHDNSQPLGSTKSGKLKLSEDGRGLSFELDTKRFTPAQLDALADGELRMSFGFAVREQEWKELEDGTILRTLKDVDLSEVSFVINPAYPDTSAAKRSLDKWQEDRASLTSLGDSFVAAADSARKLAMTELRKRALGASLKARGRH